MTGAGRPIVSDVGVLSAFQPRDELVASRVLFGLTSVGAGTTVVSAQFSSSGPTNASRALTLTACLLITVLAGVIVTQRVRLFWLWVLYPFATLALIVLLDLSSADASLTGQIFFVFPVLYAAAQLRRPAAVLVCATAVLADLIVTLSEQSGSTALVDTCFLGAALVSATVLLVGAGERNDRLIAELQHQAAVDPLTGLVTRRVLDRVAAAALQGAGDQVGTAMLLVDLDHFKQVNDVHGHPAGDAVLQQLARLLTASNRHTDVVSRMGGDEIAVFMPACPLGLARQRAAQIRNDVAGATFDISASTLAAESDRRRELRLTVSIGVAHLPTHANNLRELYAAADISLYGAKTAGRNQVGPVTEHSRQPSTASRRYGSGAA